MAGTKFADLKQRLRDAEEQLDYYRSLVGAFRDGVVPVEGASLQHHIFAKAGRKRLAELQGVPSLLRGDIA